MHSCTHRMPRMLTALLFSAALCIATAFLFTPQAHASALPTIASLIAENPMHVQPPQVRIDDDPTPLSSLIIENINSAADEAAIDSKREAFMDEARYGDFYFAQQGSGRCTITSVAMMVRRAAFLDDDASWQGISLDLVTSDGWTSAGVKNSFETAGYGIDFISTSGGAEAMIALLEEHPEGIAAYDPSVPHAVLLTDYDADSGIFYCADPAGYYSGARIPVADSWNGACRGSQESVVNGFTKAWVINR